MTPNIILASGSLARRTMLGNAGVRFRIHPADLDEAALAQAHAGQAVSFITEKLAEAKALHVSAQYPGDLVIGSDQTLDLDGRIVSKAKDRKEAEEKLKMLRGKTHILCSAVCAALGGDIVFSHTDQAALTMHEMDDAFLEHYMEQDPQALKICVGGYRIEGAGAWLFSSVKGDMFTVMGMPLLPLLDFLRREYGVTPCL